MKFGPSIFLGTNVLKYDFEVITYEDLKYEIQALE